MAALDAPQWATLAQRLPGFVRDRLTHALEQSGNPSYVLRLAVRPRSTACCAVTRMPA